MVVFQQSTTNVAPWMRANAIVSPFVPWTLALLQASLVWPSERRGQLFCRSFPWLITALALIPFCFVDSFVGSIVPSGGWRRGWAYIAHSGILAIACLSVVVLAAQTQHRQVGIRRLESQLLVITLGIGSLLCLALLSFGNFFHNVQLKLLGLITVFATYAFIGWSIAVQKIYDVRQIFRCLGHFVLLFLLLYLSILGLEYIVKDRISQPADLLVSVVVGGLLVFWLEPKSREWFDLRGAAKLSQLRYAIVEIARSEPLPERLISRLEELLRADCAASFVTLLFDMDDAYCTDHFKLPKSRAVHLAACEDGWVTPETLNRRRASAKTDELLQFLHLNSLGLLVTVPRGSPTPSLIISFGIKADECPFTYPEVERLLNIAELIDNILTRSRLTAQAALQARMEHLAMMSRGLAHDLKNLITPVSSFIMHMEGRFSSNTVEAEIHAAARNSVNVMTGYVRETLSFSEHLEPRFERVDVATTFNTACNIVAPRATNRNVSIAVRCEHHVPIYADRVLLERLVTNLVSNAIDASKVGGTVSITAIICQPGWLRLEVADQGCGIPPENIVRIFDPYFTTKQFGEDVRGFGLGLTICQKIVLLHRGTIAVKSEVGVGTTMTVNLPVDQIVVLS
jgi:signal transduction histidine kinase